MPGCISVISLAEPVVLEASASMLNEMSAFFLQIEHIE